MTTTCATADEDDWVTLECPPGTIISDIVFASYGDPSGSCGAFEIGACHATVSASVVGDACLGQNSCTVAATNDNFGDPCSGTPKRLYVEVACTPGGGTGGTGGGGTGGATGGSPGTGGAEATGGTGGTPGTDSELIGWASVSTCGPNGTTGGGDGEPTVTVTSGGELEDALTSSGALVIAVSGRIDSPGGVSGVSDKTLVGINNAEIAGGFGLSGARNVIIKNIIFSDGSGDTFELSGCECVWFDHCEFRDGSDGNLDIVRASDLVTVSWSKFYYTRSHDHMLSNLCGNGNDRPEDEGKINITFHHNWWGAGVRSRAPRVRYGQVHVFNNYYRYEQVEGEGSSNYCVGAGQYSRLLVENNYFDSVGDVITWMSDEGTAEVVERGNEIVNSGGVVTRGSSFTPPYPYTLDSAADVPNIVMSGTGPR